MEWNESFQESIDFADVKHFKNPFNVIDDKVAAILHIDQWVATENQHVCIN